MVGLFTPGDGPESGLEEPALRLGLEGRIGGDCREQPIQAFGGGMLEIEQNVPYAAHAETASRQVAEGFLSDQIAKIPGQLPRLRKQAKRVGHGLSAPSGGQPPLLASLIHGTAVLDVSRPLLRCRRIDH